MEGSEARLTVRRRWRGWMVNGALVLVLVGACVDAVSGLHGGTPGGSRRSLLADEAHGRVTSVAVMCLVVALAFWILGDTAERYFCPVVRTLADRWNLAPATAGVTLLALGNGAPDVFASLAAFTRASRVLDDETSETSAAAAAGATAAAGAIVSAGMFVSGAVVGAVALVAAPFPVDPRPFRRDVSCYLAAVIVTAVVVADGKVHAWEAAALPAYYVAFVGYVVWCDARTDPGAKERSRRGGIDMETGRTTTTAAAAAGFGPDDDERTVKTRDVASAAPLAIRASSTASRLVDRARRWFATRWREREGGSFGFGFCFGGDSALRRALDATTLVCLVAPLEVARRATIPCGDPKRWNRFYACANAALSPLLLTHLVVSFSGLELGRDVFTGLGSGGSLGFGGSLGSGGLEFAVGVGMASFAAAAVLWRVTADDAPPRWWDANGLVDAVAFLCSVAWIAAAARELTECLAAIGDVLGVTPASLSVTVLAIGNSLGDLAADVATARSGQPTMAVAACFSGPLFNMAVGLGGSFAIATWGRAGGKGGPLPLATHRGGDPLPLATHPTVAVGFVFLIVGLVATASLVPMRGYVVTRGHGYGLIALYVTYMACAVAVEVLTDGGGGGTMSESAPARWQ